MGILVFIALVILGTVLISKSTKKTNKLALKQRDWEWVKYIAEYKNIVSTKTEKKLVDSMLADIGSKSIISDDELQAIKNQVNQGEPISDEVKQVLNTSQASASSVAINQTTVSQNTNQDIEAENKIDKNNLEEPQTQILDSAIDKPKTMQLDNISLLLFFGAFLFVTSVGLFVTLSNASGWVRTISVLVVALALYGIGQWVYHSKPTLEIAGITFVGISVTITPLVGVAAYNYIADVSPQAVWFITSVICLGLYAHALITLRKPLLNYIFIFTLLSTFESGVAVMNVPIYYYGWVMIAVGLLLQAISLWKNIWPDFKDSSKAGSHIYVPLAILISLATVQTQGFGQLGVTLLLGAIFYGLDAWRSKHDAEASQLMAIVSQLSLLAGVATLFYSFNSSIYYVGCLLVGLSLGQIILIIIGSKQSAYFNNIATITLLCAVIGLLMMFEHKIAMTFALILIVAEALYVWWWQKREDAYAVAMVGWLILPNLYGIFAAEPRLTINNLIILNIASLVAQVVFFILFVRTKALPALLEIARSAMFVQIVVVTIIACFGKPLVTLGALTLVSLVLLVLSFVDKSKNYWELTSGVIISLVVLRGWNDPVVLPAIMIALIFNILLAIRFRSESNRWISTGLWMLLPIGLGGYTTNNVWSTNMYAWAYIFVMAGLIISRMIARGVVFASSKIPLSAYARNNSLSYSFGYIFAACLSVIISLFSNQSQLHTTAILLVLGLTITFLAWVVEKDVDLIALLPLLLQAILISAIRPSKNGNTLIFFILISSAAAVGCYILILLLKQSSKNRLLNVDLTEQITLAASFIAPGSFFYAANSLWVMPVSLGITGGMFFDYWHDAAQAKKEWAVGIMTAALMWLMYVLGVREVQAYTHILALMFASFAWWRNTLGNKKSSDDYIYAALAISTVPLIIQSISSDAGGIYGWWLLLEQVMFMIIGALIHKRFVVLWGLYVAIGSVLYQLRHLGYAALAVLAIFVIGMAIYQLQRSNKAPNSEDKNNKNVDKQKDVSNQNK